MKQKMLIGIVLIVIGVIALGYSGITYTSHDKVIDLGPLQVSADRKHTIPIPPILGGLALVGGLVLLISGYKKG
jgi:hypothetical protein